MQFPIQTVQHAGQSDHHEDEPASPGGAAAAAAEHDHKYNAVKCQVCKEFINIDGKENQLVVKCANCGEATPIKTAPPGKRYIRCTCNCLLICKISSQRIACPRPNCTNVISITRLEPNENEDDAHPHAGAAGEASDAQRGSQSEISLLTAPSIRAVCACCGETFFVANRDALRSSRGRQTGRTAAHHHTPSYSSIGQSEHANSQQQHVSMSAQCPHCKKRSSIGPRFSTLRSRICIGVALTFLIIAIAVTAGTAHSVSANKWIAAIDAILFAVSLVFFALFVFYFKMPQSTIESIAHRHASSSNNRVV